MLFQFLKQNKFYLIIFISYWLYNILVSAAFYKLMHLNSNFGDKFLTLPNQFFGASYNLIVTAGIVHFGVFCFYKAKEVSEGSVSCVQDKIEV